MHPVLAAVLSTVFGAVALAALTAGCAAPIAGSASPSAAAPAVAPTVARCCAGPEVVAPTAAATPADVAYLAALRKQGIGTGDDEVELRRGYSMCALLRNGTTFRQAVTALQTNGFTVRDAGYVVGLAVAAYCPDQGDKVTA